MSLVDSHKMMIRKIQNMLDEDELELNEYDSAFFKIVSSRFDSGKELTKKQSDHLFTIFHNC